jgi:serine/threonine-protein kinase
VLPSATEPAIERIGRYEIAGRIALGGMAEIVLARLLGPSGFERPVVIKRILPHLAEDPAIVDMFLDEARIVARIRHPNVVQVSELGRHDGELFLVMEYLEGETVASLVRRLSGRGRRCDHDLAAYVCACVATGLHAAHELRDEDDVCQDLVHRDVSPQNVFVTYDGAVKVLDFGIAKVADRVTKTVTGEIKGKLEYMSPEQILGEDLDRRSDLFSLGIVLYEMATGRRLFKRPTTPAIIQAITSEPLVRPTSVDPELPEALSRICTKALARDPADRYSTAMEMRRDLMGFLESSSPEALPEERLAHLMRELFHDRIEEKRGMLRRLRAGSRITSVPAGETDEHIVLPTIEGVEIATRIQRRAARGLRTKRLALGVTLALAVLVAALGAWRGSSLIEAWRGPSNGGEASPTAPGASDSSSPSVVTAEPITIVVTSTPSGALVSLDGRELGRTPHEEALPRSDEPVLLTLTLEGFEPAEQLVVPNITSRVQVRMVPATLASEAPSNAVRSEMRSRHRRARQQPEEAAPSPMVEWRRFN